jgi:PBP1b-binding outer membrane lipoprotein LpoB
MSTEYFKKSHIAMIFSAALVLGGCVSGAEPRLVEQDFGKSVAQFKEAQTYDMQAAETNESKPVMVTDGEYEQRVVDEMRKDATRPQPESISNIINVGIGQ